MQSIFYITVKLGKPWAFRVSKRFIAGVLNQSQYEEKKCRTREKTSKPQLIIITAGVCGLVFSHLIGFSLGAQ